MYFKWLEVDTLAIKNQAFNTFKAYLSREERLTSNRLVTLGIDGGREFNNKEFNSFYREKGITRDLSAPYAHEQNGLAERINRTILNKLRSLLFTARLNKKL